MAAQAPAAAAASSVEPLRLRLGPPCAAAALKVLGPTLRLTIAGVEALVPWWRGGRPLIYTLWHARLLIAPWVHWRLRATHGARAVTVLASASNDGELVVRYAARFGVPSVRGSSSRGGAAAVRALLAVLRDGSDVLVVPDGPRGPAERLQGGVVLLAALTGAPVVPLAFAARPALRVSSWDRFLIPAPFARAAAVFGAPITVERVDDRATARARVQSALDDVTARADALVR